MKQNAILIVGLAFVIALLPVSTYAQNASENDASNAICNTAKKRVASHAAAISKLQADHSAKYAALKGRVDTLITSATAAQYTGIDKLTAARDSVATSLAAFEAQAKLYKTALDATQVPACGEQTGDFLSAVEAARVELTSLRSSGLAVKMTIKQNAVPALREYATWLKDNKTTSQEKS